MTAQEIGALTIIGLYMMIPLVMGFIASRKALPTSEDYFLQGRGMGGIFVFFTVVTTWWSAFAFLGSNAFFFTRGPLYWTAMAWNVFFGVLYYVLGKRIWYFGRTNKYMTPKDFFVHHYGSNKLGNFIVLALMIFTVPNLQIQLTGGAYLIEVGSGGMIPFWLAALLFYVVIIVYVWAGGVRAIAWTDILHGVMLFFGMVFGGIFVANLLGGPVDMFRQLAVARPENLILHDGDWMPWIAMFLITPIGVLMGPHMWTRMYAVKSSKIFSIMPFLIGFVALAYMGSMLVGNSAVILEPNIDRPDTVLPVILLQYAPYFFAVLVIACGATAAMSTANSQVHSMSSIYAIDFHKAYINKHISDQKLVWVGRYAILVLSAFAYVMALFATDLLVIIGLFALSGTAQVVVPTIGALFWKRSTVAGAAAGMAVGLLLIVVFQFQPFGITAPGPFAVGGGGLLGLLCNAAVFVVVSLLTKPRPDAIINEINDQYKAFYHGKNA